MIALPEAAARRLPPGVRRGLVALGGPAVAVSLWRDPAG
jgi:hypothetical protein